MTVDPETIKPLFTYNEFRAIVAVCSRADPSEHPRYEPRPRTYAEAAERLELPAATVRKRIENVRQKLVDSGVVELRQPDARLALAEFLLSTPALVTPADLPVLDRVPRSVKSTATGGDRGPVGLRELIGHGGSFRRCSGHTTTSSTARWPSRCTGSTERSKTRPDCSCASARAADHLASHPNIATIHRAAISEHGQPYVVMEEAAA